jgi:hypothetical protein
MNQMFAVASACALCLAASLSSRAQVIYEPVQHQFSSGGRHYYYGGSDPRVHQRANQLSQETTFGRSNGWAFHSGSIDTHREVGTEPTRAYSDMIPYWNARVYRYTDGDARNAANANAARYFRKADLRSVAQVQPDGTWAVPSAGDTTHVRGTIDIRPYRGPATMPKPILSIPKRLLDQPLWGSGRTTADAR